MSRLAVPAVIAVMIATACAGPWRGRIVEQDTDRPVEGVVIIAYWFDSGGTLVTSHGAGRTRRVEEVVTDAEGRFAVPIQWGLWGTPALVIFKGGYGRWRFQGTDPSTQFSGSRIVIELPRLTTKKERLDILGSEVSLPGDVPHDKTPLLRGAVQQERSALGLH